MTELEKLERAKMYIEKLAQGINPIDDTYAADSDIINNVRLSRCFFYVADILSKIIENGGITEPKYIYTKSKPSFFLSEEEKKMLKAVDSPLSVKEIAEKINALKDESFPSNLKVTSIGKWLTEIGMLEIIKDENGKNKKIPTESGNSVGIITVQKISSYGFPYYPVLYTKAAQQFIYDNIDAVIELNNTAKKKEKAQQQGKPWDFIQEECLKELHKNGATVGEIANSLNRSENAIRARMKLLGLSEE